MFTTNYSGHVAIVAKFHGPTDTKGSRIIVRRADHRRGDKSYTHHWDYSLSTDENFQAAVSGLLNAYEWDGTWTIGGGRDVYYAVKTGR